MITPQDLAAAKLALGERLAVLRRAVGLKQVDLARRALISRSTVANVERGRQPGTRDFWTRCDDIVRADGLLLGEYEHLCTLQRRHLREAAYLRPTGVLDVDRAATSTLRATHGDPDAIGPAVLGGGVASDGEDDLIASRHSDTLDATPSLGSVVTIREVVRRQIPLIRCVLDAHDLPADGPVRALPMLREDVALLVRMRLQSNYRRLAVRLPEVLPELHRALVSSVGQHRTMVATLLVQAYRAADAVADKFGYYDLSARIIGLMHQSARDSGDEGAIAAASYVRAETFFANGQFEVGRLMLERAAERLVPEAGIGSATAYGALHMRAAVLAARAGSLVRARDHLMEAGSWSHGLPDGVYAGTVFGPASVRIHEVALAVDGGDPDAALAIAARWSPQDDLPAERRSHFYIDLARAFAMVQSPEQALTALLTARTVAPEHVHDHPQVLETLSELASSRLGHDTRLQEYRAWVGDGTYIR